MRGHDNHTPACPSQLEWLVGGSPRFPSTSCLLGQTLRGVRAKKGLLTLLEWGPVTFEDEGSDSLGLNCMVATWRPAGEQLLGFTQLLEAPSVPNYRLFKAFDLSTHPPGPQQIQI